ncbi:MAG: YkgJ family cysteine cluster protein [Candidatus Helarchaeales archaeon]
MKSAKELTIHLRNPSFRAIADILEPVLELLELEETRCEIFSKRLLLLDRNSPKKPKFAKFVRFQGIISEILARAKITNDLKLHDATRKVFLTRIPIRSTNCLTECRSIHGCCHGQYTVELIDYERIISKNLLSRDDFMKFRNKYKLKLVGKDDAHCIAFNASDKTCKIHEYKPVTCTKYPIMPCVFKATPHLTWSGKCAHGGTWETQISPILLKSLDDLWRKALRSINLPSNSREIRR